MIELVIDSASVGGVGVGRDDGGRVVFVEGALPGERVTAELHTEKKRFAKGHIRDVVTPSPHRIEPICATSRAGCGGCDLAHANLEEQRRIKEQVVIDSITRIGRVGDVPLITTRTTLTDSYRTTVRLGVVDGLAGYRRRWSHEIIHPTECRVAHPAVEELILTGRWGDATEVTIRVSEHTGQRIAIVDGDVRSVTVPDDVTVVSEGAAGEAQLIVHAGGREWQLSGDAFFQSGSAAATALVEAVATAAGSTDTKTVVDAYAGIGLFGGTVAAEASSLISIEVSPVACADARVNLANHRSADSRMTVVQSAVEDWLAEPADLVIADPARSGLGARGVDALVATGADQFVLVSCDPGSLGRDVGLLSEAHYRIESIELVDAFADTSHIESVVSFRRSGTRPN